MLISGKLQKKKKSSRRVSFVSESIRCFDPVGLRGIKLAYDPTWDRWPAWLMASTFDLTMGQYANSPILVTV